MLNSENKPTKVTILDIAQKADVSPSTVSRVLRNSAGVAKKKHDAVMQAVAELNYRPNIFAQSLASGQSMTIGVLTQNFGTPFYDGILQGILSGMEKTDYWPIFADGRWHPATEQKALEQLLARRVDGLILVGGQIDEEALQKIADHKPLIVVARKLKTMPNHCLYMDNFQAAYRTMQYLLEMGHRDIAHITASVVYHDSVNDIHKRLEGYEQALRDAGIEPDPRLVVEGNLQQSSGVLAVEMLLSQGRPFSAIFAANDQMAFGVRLALYRRGIRVPEDVSLVGFDDESSAAYMVPPLTTIRQPAIELGETAARAILHLLKEEPFVIPEFSTELIIRESVARFR
ncbi:MAG: LacI family DNA-binding transcriptional regulator [Chloroflexi bacterium]|nr:LacI family DNA-binding transcriptional regulator [Chloroflexota bacterium]